jgi:hypothetical protein
MEEKYERCKREEEEEKRKGKKTRSLYKKLKLVVIFVPK